MDEPSLPSAAELGISDAEYERILRGLGQGQVVDEPLEEVATRQRRSSRVWLAVLAVVLAVALLPRLGLGGSQEPPTYAFLEMVGNQPVAYSSCRLIQVAVYPAGGPPDAEQLVREAVARVSGATGLDIVVTGSFGGTRPTGTSRPRPSAPATRSASRGRTARRWQR